MTYRITYIDIHGTMRDATLTAYGARDAVNKFFDEYAPVMEILLLVRA